MEPEIEAAFFDLNDDLWQTIITATPEDGFFVDELWSVQSIGEEPNDQANLGEVVLGSPIDNGDGSVSRDLQVIELDPQGATEVLIQPGFFMEETVSVTFQSSPGGTTTPNGTVALEIGTPSAITAIPDPGHRFTFWEITSGSANIDDPNNPNARLTPATDCVIKANFNPNGEWVIFPNSLNVPEGELRYVQISLSEPQSESTSFSVVRASGPIRNR